MRDCSKLWTQEHKDLCCQSYLALNKGPFVSFNTKRPLVKSGFKFFIA